MSELKYVAFGGPETPIGMAVVIDDLKKWVIERIEENDEILLEATTEKDQRNIDFYNGQNNAYKRLLRKFKC